jgi:hypothetical protein
MRRTAIGWLLAATAATAATSSQLSFAAELPDLLSGDRFPLTLKLKNLNNEWRGFSMSGQYEMGEWMQTFSSMFGNSASNTYYTKGQTVNIGNETYMVAYRIESRSDKLTPETTLSLSLLNLRTIGSLNNIRLFNVEQEIVLFDRMKKTSPFNFPVPPSTPRPSSLAPLPSPPPLNQLSLPLPPPVSKFPSLPSISPPSAQIKPRQEQRTLPRLAPTNPPLPTLEPQLSTP